MNRGQLSRPSPIQSIVQANRKKRTMPHTLLSPTPIKPEPPHHIPLASLAGVAITGFCAFLNLYATQPLLPSLQTFFGASTGEVSMTVSATSLGVALAAPFIGVFADRWGRK